LKAPNFAAACAAIMVVVSITSPTVAAQLKTAKQCRNEWRADKAENRAKRIKERDYVAQCRRTPAPSAATTEMQSAAPKAQPRWARWRWRARVPTPEAREPTGATWY